MFSFVDFGIVLTFCGHFMEFCNYFPSPRDGVESATSGFSKKNIIHSLNRAVVNEILKPEVSVS